MPIILKYLHLHSRKYDSVNNGGLEAGTLFYEHINSDSTVEGISHQDIFTIRANKTACRSIIITQNFVRVKP